MLITAEPFLSAEISYRQQRVADSFRKHSRRRHRKVPRRHGLRLPEQGNGTVIVA